jgi:signal-transduction protein with cAMP-binding, CBS, and nucleotidyltransferase domain
VPRRSTHEHSVTGGFARRLAHLRATLPHDHAEAGDQGLKLLEEYLEHLAVGSGYRHETGSIGRYASWVRHKDLLDRALLDRVETFAQVRNCLAHSYGLQTSPDLAHEIVEFLGALIHEETTTAAAMMTAEVRAIAETMPLREARELMLREGFGRLPVLRADQTVVALLVERDLVAAEALGDAAKPLTVAAALPPQARRRFTVVAAAAAYPAIVEALRRQGIEALIVTRDGRRNQPPLGIITHADVLYRM